MNAADSEEALRAIFGDSTFEAALLDTGFRKPFQSLILSDRLQLKKVMQTHVFIMHVFIT